MRQANEVASWSHLPLYNVHSVRQSEDWWCSRPHANRVYALSDVRNRRKNKHWVILLDSDQISAGTTSKPAVNNALQRCSVRCIHVTPHESGISVALWVLPNLGLIVGVKSTSRSLRSWIWARFLIVYSWERKWIQCISLGSSMRTKKFSFFTLGKWYDKTVQTLETISCLKKCSLPSLLVSNEVK